MNADPTLTSCLLKAAMLLVRGYTRSEMATLLEISKRTVDSHRDKILKTLGLRNNSELTLWAIRQGGFQPEKSDRAEPLKFLTARERQVAILLAGGKNRHEVAKQLDIEAATVDTHRGGALKKLRLRNTSQLTAYTFAHGLIDETGAPIVPDAQVC